MRGGATLLEEDNSKFSPSAERKLVWLAMIHPGTGLPLNWRLLVCCMHIFDSVCVIMGVDFLENTK